MSVVISTNYVISDSLSGGGVINANNPVFGRGNLVTVDNIETTTEEPANPATFMANPSTNLRWIGLTGSPAADEYVTLTINATDPVDYIAIARHNLGSAQIAVSVEYFDPTASPDTWEELIAPVMLATDGPALFRFPPANYSALRLRLQPGDDAPTIAVVYAGPLLVLQRRIYVGHTPMPFGRKTKVTNARSEAGHFLGRIVLGQQTGTGFTMDNLTPAWYRAYMEPFLLEGQQVPFFFAWRPQSYPREVGYGWFTNDPMPKNSRANGMMQIEIQMGGIV